MRAGALAKLKRTGPHEVSYQAEITPASNVHVYLQKSH